MKYFIYEELDSVYWKDGDEIGFAPLNQDGTFDDEDGGIVEFWDEVKEHESIVKEALGIK
jgi:hypothetical protein